MKFHKEDKAPLPYTHRHIHQNLVFVEKEVD